jgi:hypothetical protein
MELEVSNDREQQDPTNQAVRPPPIIFFNKPDTVAKATQRHRQRQL